MAEVRGKNTGRAHRQEILIAQSLDGRVTQPGQLREIRGRDCARLRGGTPGRRRLIAAEDQSLGQQRGQVFRKGREGLRISALSQVQIPLRRPAEGIAGGIGRRQAAVIQFAPGCGRGVEAVLDLAEARRVHGVHPRAVGLHELHRFRQRLVGVLPQQHGRILRRAFGEILEAGMPELGQREIRLA